MPNSRSSRRFRFLGVRGVGIGSREDRTAEDGPQGQEHDPAKFHRRGNSDAVRSSQEESKKKAPAPKGARVGGWRNSPTNRGGWLRRPGSISPAAGHAAGNLSAVVRGRATDRLLGEPLLFSTAEMGVAIIVNRHP